MNSTPLRQISAAIKRLDLEFITFALYSAEIFANLSSVGHPNCPL